MTTDSLRDRVERGAKLLDEKDPGWAGKIDVPSLHMGMPCGCIVGQRFDDYCDGLRFLIDSGVEGSNYGFDLGIHADDYSYGDLKVLWVEQIKARLDA